MRNPARMHPLLSLLHELWGKYPDMRLNQLLQMVAAHRAQRLGVEPQVDLFYLEDDALLEQLQIELGKPVRSVDPYHV